MSDDFEILTPDVRFHLIQKMESHKVIALQSTELLPHEGRYLQFHNVAGVILFGRNVSSLSQVTDLLGGVSEKLDSGELPPLVMADHEGDFVAELSRIIGVPPAAMALAASGDTSLAYEVAYETGAVMKKLGVNTVLAPVCDCFLDVDSPITGLRSFGADPERVAEFVTRTVAGFRAAGVLTCAKHFPGHGATADDSHETLPEVKKSREDLEAADLIPFRAAVDEGVDMVMMSHIAFPMGRDEIVPASFDRRIMQEMLRGDLGFQGPIITDAVEMAGARWYAQSAFGASGGYERALLAGADIVLHSRPVPESVQLDKSSRPVASVNVMDTIIKTLEKVVDRGKIEEEVARAAAESEPLRNVLNILDTSGERVDHLRRKAADRARPVRAPSRSKVIEFDAYPSVPSVYATAAERGIALWPEGSTAPRPDVGEPHWVLPIDWTAAPALAQQDLSAFVEALCRPFNGWSPTRIVRGFEIGAGGEIVPQFAEDGGQTVIDATRFTGEGSIGAVETERDAIIVLSARGTPDGAFLDALTTFAEHLRPRAVVLTGWPVTSWIPEDTYTLLSLGASQFVAAATAAILSGESEPTGRAAGLFSTTS